MAALRLPVRIWLNHARAIPQTPHTLKTLAYVGNAQDWAHKGYTPVNRRWDPWSWNTARPVLQLSGGGPCSRVYSVKGEEPKDSFPSNEGVSGSTSSAEGGSISRARKASPLIGFVAGLVGSVVGVGGGTLIVPMVALLCSSIPQRVISGTSLAPVISTGSAASFVYGSSGSVDFYAAMLIGSTAVLAAPLGARMTMVMDNKKLKRTLGYFLIAAALITPIKLLLTGALNPADVSVAAQSSNIAAATGGFGGLPIPLLMCTGLAAGFASGLLGIGGGTIATPVLAIATAMPQTCVLGTSLCAMIPPSIVGLAQHHRLGNVDWLLAGGLAIGTMVGGLVGSTTAMSISDNALKGIFAVTMLALGNLTLQKAK